MKKTLKELSLELSSVVLYRNVLESPVLAALMRYLESPETGNPRAVLYSNFVRALYEAGGDLSAYLEDVLRCDDNVYIKKRAAGAEISDYMEAEFRRELEVFTALSKVTAEDLLPEGGLPAGLAGFENSGRDLTKLIPEALEHVSTAGYGIYARYGMFQLGESGKLEPVLSPDKVIVDELVGYEMERNQVINNTRALIEGKPAANTLLTGDAGTGKSSTIKAVANLFRKDGLRLVELKKEQLPELPLVMGEISTNPLKFIIFIDDLSFAADDDNFGALKAVLEGSASAKADNAVIYATSNRRHMIKETFSSRDGDDIHRNDTMEEQTSLSARFGLTILYQKPNKALYLEIVHTLAERKHIDMPEETLDIQAEAFALRKGRRSARVAEQFTDSLLVQV